MMSYLQYLPLVVMGIALTAFALPQAARAYKRWRRLHLVLCPTTDQDALVQIGKAPKGAHRCPVTDCSEWPKHRACSQECAHGLLYDTSDAHSNHGHAPPSDRAVGST